MRYSGINTFFDKRKNDMGTPILFCLQKVLLVGPDVGGLH
jgi:hypothetical protein